jgi:dimethylargininase
LMTAEFANSGLLEGVRALVVPEEERAVTNALRVNDVLFIRAGFRRTQEMLLKRGLNVVPLPASEIGKLDAGLSCMSLRWWARPPG